MTGIRSAPGPASPHRTPPLAIAALSVPAHFLSERSRPPLSPLQNYGIAGTPRLSEDCLYLNVWAPTHALGEGAAKKLPVRVFIHGGSYISGSGGWSQYSSCQVWISVNRDHRYGGINATERSMVLLSCLLPAGGHHLPVFGVNILLPVVSYCLPLVLCCLILASYCLLLVSYCLPRNHMTPGLAGR